MTTHLTITVDVDAAAVENALDHAALAVEQRIMTSDDVRLWLSDDLTRFVTAR